ncbi:MAG TPA: diguanylate cyclase [Solirubrobacteraceae bacterium]|nr:diguanylate cyclase [Solirubrobacteraceae bacterium]
MDELTKGWLLALLEHASLDEAPGILAADLPRDGPRVCEAVVRALADDADLRRIEPDGQLEPLVSRTGQLAGATTPEASIRAVDTLEAVIWSAIRSELRDDDPDLVAEVSERLSRIVGLVRAAVLRGGGATSSAPGGPPGTHLRPLPDPQQSSRAQDPGGPSARRPEPPEPEDPETLAGDEQVWVGVLDRELTRAQRSGSPLSLLLLELEEAERVLAVEPPGEAAATFGRFAQTVRGVMRRQDILACESDARAWIIARDTSRAGAQALAARTAGSVRMAQAWRGAPLTVSIGVAVLGEDGSASEELIDSAEQSRLAAAAEGVGVYRGGARGEPPVGGGPEAG